MPFSWIVFAGLLAIYLFVQLRARRQPRAPTRPITDEAAQRFLLVLLLREPLALTADSLETAACAAWIDRFGPNPDGSPFVESGAAGAGFVLHAHGNALLVLEMPREQRHLQRPVQAFPASALEAWPSHAHDVSLGIAYPYDTHPGTLAAYVASLAAALIAANKTANNVLGVLHLAGGRLWQFDAETTQRLVAEPEAFFSMT